MPSVVGNNKCLGNNKGIGNPMNDKHLWALRPEAKQALDELVAKGMDRDLALTVFESLVPETEIYDLEDPSE